MVSPSVKLKNIDYTRYLNIQYAFAMLLFSNLNWLIVLLLYDSNLFFIPLSLLGVSVFAIIEQIKLYSRKGHPLKYTKRYFIIQIIVNASLSVLSFYKPFGKSAFPFMATNRQGMLGTAFVLGVGILLAIASIRKINQLGNYRKSLKVSGADGR